MKTFLKSFFRNESGASAAEYALILAIVGVALGAAALYLSATIAGSITTAGNEVASGCRGADGAVVDCTEVPNLPK